MPVQQITVVPASSGKSASRSKETGSKAPGRSGSRSSNVSKASNSTAGLTTRTSVTPSSQDVCSSGQLIPLEEDASESRTCVSAATGGACAQAQKKQVKRRHRRKRSSCVTLDCAETNGKPEQTDRSERSLSSDRSERGERGERRERCSLRSRRELPPRLRCAGAPRSDSSSEGEAWREARSWSKEKARRARRRSGSSREREDGANEAGGGQERADAMELQSVGSDDGKEKQPVAEDARGLKKRHSNRGPMERSRASSLAEDTEEKHPERGSAVASPHKHGAVNGAVQRLCSDDSELEVCRICHCEGDDECPLIMPCRCTGSLSFVHQACLNQWIKSSDTRCCELCKFDFVMEMKLKPLRKWEKLHMSKSERRKIFCSVLFHLIAIVCMLWSVVILVKRTTEEIRLGRNGVLEWPFWTKLIVVAIGFTGGLIFMYIQCKVYLQLWRRLKAFNRIITVQNCPEKDLHAPQTKPGGVTNGSHDAVEVPIHPAPEAQVDSDVSVEAAVAPAQNPV